MTDTTPTRSQPTHDATTRLPAWLRSRHAHDIREKWEAVEVDAQRDGLAFGVAADKHLRALLDAEAGKSPSERTAGAYRRDYANMLAEQLTPYDKASTFQHFNRLRSAFRFAELEAIAELRKEADKARRSKDHETMKRLTGEALERAAVYEALFLSPGRPTWGAKAAALRAAGDGMGKGKSKRAAGRRAPTPDQLLVRLSQQAGRAVRVEVAAMCFALFGVRPAELKLGARLEVAGDGLSLLVQGAKVDAVRGQAVRRLTVAASRTEGGAGFGQSELAVKMLRQWAADGDGLVQVSDADLQSVRRAMRQVQPGLSPYAYRHARASDAKASKDRATVAAWMGHANDRSQSYYGHKRSGSGAVKVEAAVASRPVRAVKSLPETLAQKLAKAVNLHTKAAAGRAQPAAATPSPKRKGPRLR